jgi:hypothetical protein
MLLFSRLAYSVSRYSQFCYSYFRVIIIRFGTISLHYSMESRDNQYAYARDTLYNICYHILPAELMWRDIQFLTNCIYEIRVTLNV